MTTGRTRMRRGRGKQPPCLYQGSFHLGLFSKSGLPTKGAM